MNVFVLIIAFALAFGELRCIYQFFTSDFEPTYKREIIYGVGMLTPMGGIIGYFNIPDKKNDNSRTI